AAQGVDDLIGDVHTRADRDGVLDNQVVILLLGDLLDRGVGLFHDGGKFLVAAAVEIFLEFAALALQVGIHVLELALTLDALGLGQHGGVLVELLGFGTQAVGQALQFLVALLEFGFDLGLSRLGGLGLAQDAFRADET